MYPRTEFNVTKYFFILWNNQLMKTHDYVKCDYIRKEQISIFVRFKRGTANTENTIYLQTKY